MKVKKSLGSKIRGWLPQEPLLKSRQVARIAKPEVKAELDEFSKRLIKAIPITNPIIGAVIYAANSSSHNIWGNWGAMALFFTELFLALLATNVSLYLYIRHRATQGGARG